MSKLDPLAQRSLSFIFPRCQARLDGNDLLVTVPSPRVTFRGGSVRSLSSADIDWTPPAEVAHEVVIDCADGVHERTDRHEYPVSTAYQQSIAFRFRGGVTYGRIATPNGWALGVQAPVMAITGLPPAWSAWQAVMVETNAHPTDKPVRKAGTLMAAADSTTTTSTDPTDGPHLPYP